MEKYLAAWWDNIEPISKVNVIKETKCFFFLRSGRWEKDVIFDTFEEAKNHLVNVIKFKLIATKEESERLNDKLLYFEELTE